MRSGSMIVIILTVVVIIRVCDCWFFVRVCNCWVFSLEFVIVGVGVVVVLLEFVIVDGGGVLVVIRFCDCWFSPYYWLARVVWFPPSPWLAPFLGFLVLIGSLPCYWFPRLSD